MSHDVLAEAIEILLGKRPCYRCLNFVKAKIEQGVLLTCAVSAWISQA